MQDAHPQRWGCSGCRRPVRVCGGQPVFDRLGYSWHANCVPQRRAISWTVDLTCEDGGGSADAVADAADAADAEAVSAADAVAAASDAAGAENIEWRLAVAASVEKKPPHRLTQLPPVAEK